MAKINLNLEILVGKDIVFRHKLTADYFSAFANVQHFVKVQGKIEGFAYDGDYWLLVNDNFYVIDDIDIISID